MPCGVGTGVAVLGGAATAGFERAAGVLAGVAGVERAAGVLAGVAGVLAGVAGVERAAGVLAAVVAVRYAALAAAAALVIVPRRSVSALLTAWAASAYGRGERARAAFASAA